jgi:hypothetical protein
MKMLLLLMMTIMMMVIMVVVPVVSSFCEASAISTLRRHIRPDLESVGTIKRPP